MPASFWIFTRSRTVCRLFPLFSKRAEVFSSSMIAGCPEESTVVFFSAGGVVWEIASGTTTLVSNRMYREIAHETGFGMSCIVARRYAWIGRVFTGGSSDFNARLVAHDGFFLLRCFNLHQFWLCGGMEVGMRFERLRPAAEVDQRGVMHAGDGAIGSAGFCSQKFALNVANGVVGEGRSGIAALLRAVMHQAVFADIKVA